MVSRDRPGADGIAWRQLAWHYVTMVAAMLVGMAVLGMATRLVLTMLGHADVLDPIEVRVAVMVISMAAGMTAWMGYHRHRWAGIVEMNAAMVLSFAVVLVPVWTGALPESAVMALGHVLMLPAMALVLLRRRAEYGKPHHRPSRSDAAGGLVD